MYIAEFISGNMDDLINLLTKEPPKIRSEITQNITPNRHLQKVEEDKFNPSEIEDLLNDSSDDDAHNFQDCIHR